MAMTDRQIDGVVKLFARSFLNETRVEERKKLYVQFQDAFGKSIGEWEPNAIEKLKQYSSSEELIDEFKVLGSKEKEDLSSGIVIRKLSRTDFEQVRELVNGEFSLILTAYDENGLQKFLKSKYSFVACRDSEIFGVILADEMPNVTGISIYIDTFVVAGNVRGMGIGHKLYKAATHVSAEERGIATIILRTERNREAYQIYKHWGFCDEELIYMRSYMALLEKRKKWIAK